LTLAQATAEIERSARVIAIATAFGCEAVKLANRATLVVKGGCVVTVLSRRRRSKACMSAEERS
jgi:hypothetical protein